MPKRKPERDQALQIFISKKGKITPKEIAEQLSISAATVRKWKCQDKWEERFPKSRSKRKRGGQPGNKNAIGNSGGAPAGNLNAQTHGAFRVPRIETWDADRRAEINSLRLDFDSNALDQYRQLKAKEMDLEQLLANLSGEPTDKLHFDRQMTMTMPEGGTMKYRSESTTFSRRMQIENEINKVHGRILKLLDSMKSMEMERQRLRLEQQRFEFGKQKALGIFNTDSDGNAVDEPEDNLEDKIIE
ncbi:MAG: phage terminase small subunit [Clostridia bacterium]|nr:phage terminase small subunit [Clostridia bacterium]